MTFSLSLFAIKIVSFYKGLYSAVMTDRYPSRIRIIITFAHPVPHEDSQNLNPS